MPRFSALLPSGCSFRGGELAGRPGVGIAHTRDDGADRLDDELGLLVLDVVATLACDEVPAVWHERGELVLQRLPEPLVCLVDTRVGVGLVDSAVAEHVQG